MKKRVVTIGEILMRLTTSDHLRFIQTSNYIANFGGSEANVAASLSYFGIETAHISVLPDTEIGIAAKRFFHHMEVDTSHIALSSKGRMGIYFLEKGTAQRASKIIYDRFHSAFSDIDPKAFDWERILSNTDLLHWTGITPAISEAAANFCAYAINEAKKRNITISGDINYRRNLWQYGKLPQDVMPNLIHKTDLIIAGLSDLNNYLGKPEDKFEDACSASFAHFPNVKAITATHRETLSASHNQLSALYVTKEKTYRSKTYTITPIIDRIGSGDAFAAGLLYGHLCMEKQAALEFAVAAAVLKHTISGDINLVTPEEVINLSEGHQIGKLLR